MSSRSFFRRGLAAHVLALVIGGSVLLSGIGPAEAAVPLASKSSPAAGSQPGPSATPPAATSRTYLVQTFGTAYGYLSPFCVEDNSPRCRPQGELWAAPRNYVFCKKWGEEMRIGSSYNHWWLLTDLDRVYPGRSGRAYVSAYYLSRWGNDVAKDNYGNVIPNC
jgi:uncharacterized protein (DUF779 family)